MSNTEKSKRKIVTDTKRLILKIDESGRSVSFLARKLGISREAFYKKRDGETEFKASEIVALSELLDLSLKERDEIFLSECVN